jgi:hypothetical protein
MSMTHIRYAVYLALSIGALAAWNLAVAPRSARAIVAIDAAALNPTCIESNRISDTRVVDERTLVVRMNPGPEYMRIDLGNNCSTLDKSTGFSFGTSIPKLCTADTLTVLRSGQGCIIEKMTPVSADEAKALERAK